MDIGREITMEIGGKMYTFSRLTRRRMMELRDWVAEMIGDPFDFAERFIKHVNEKEAINLIRDAKDIRDQLACFDLSQPIAQKYLKSQEGIVQLLYVLLKTSHEDITIDEAYELAHAINPDELEKILTTTQGSNGREAGKPTRGKSFGSPGRTSSGG